MSDQWYWKHRGELLGPFETEVLADLIRKRRVADRDEIRLATSSEWLTGTKIKDLFAKNNVSSSSSDVAAFLLSQPAKLQRTHQVETCENGGIVTASLAKLQLFVETLVESLTDLGERLGQLLISGLGLIRVLGHRKFIYALVAATFVTIIAARVKTGRIDLHRQIYDELTSTWSKLQEMKTAGASRDDRMIYRDNVLPRLDTTLQLLIRDSKQNPSPSSDLFTSIFPTEREWEIVTLRRALIHATQAIQAVMRDPIEKDVDAASAEVFQKHIQVAQEVIEGRYQYRKPRGMVDSSKPGSQTRIDILTGGILVLDILLVVGGLWFWLRARIS